MEASQDNKPSGFRETVFTQCKDSFVRPEKPIIRRDISGIQQNFGVPLKVNESNPIKEHLPFNPKIQKIRNVNMSTKKDEISSKPKSKGEFFVDIYKESKKYEVTEKPNQVKFFPEKRFNDEAAKKIDANNISTKAAPIDKLVRVDKIMNSNSMKSLLTCEANEKHLAKKSTVDREALLAATRNCPITHKKNSNYKHMVTSNGQIIYKE